MSGETFFAWVVFGIGAALYLVTSLVAGVAARRAPGIRLLRPASDTENGTNGGTSRMAHYDAAVPVASRAAMYISLVVTATALFVALSEYVSDQSQLGVIVGVGVIGGLALVHVIAGALRLNERSGTEKAVRPLEVLFEGIALIPGLRALLLRASGTPAFIENPDDVVTAAFEQNLDLLEAAGVATDVEELRMIRGVLDLDTTRVREIMRPRVDMVVAEAEATRREIADLMINEGYSKIPVFRGQIDDVLGIVYARDLLKAELGESNGDDGILALVRPAIFVPESQFLEHLLQEFQRHRVKVAIVVDEYGGVSGLVTHEDLVEEIVGELEDEFDQDEPELQKITEHESLVDARLTLDSLNETFDTDIEGDGFDTVGGLIYRELGRMPIVADSVSVANLVLTVESTMGRRIRQVRVVQQETAAENA
ncbi:MAG: HlyC/CorC family transporter [Chloroflexi bacterium]|jgi:putative hemolysin|nr:HlyC/CorC family transporter [Chloroflexota bacterium]MBT4072878.1 HlyC/CorC family transporter [Chloroflexota bacterium]MBT5320059.1 HlyC/CorC family transporter [Chloroflexota bacterium]